VTRTFGDFQRLWAAKHPQMQPPGIVPARAPEAPMTTAHELRKTRLRVGGTVQFRRCRCGSAWFVIKAGKGPHAGQLRCNACGAFGRWLAHREMAAAS
jgi:hypothetical protein